MVSLSGFEIPTYLLAKCKPKLENASWNFKHLLKNASQIIEEQLPNVLNFICEYKKR